LPGPGGQLEEIDAVNVPDGSVVRLRSVP
jgi:hypothetical protein